MDQTVCHEKRTLLALYQHATQIYSEAVTDLDQKIGTTSKLEYEALHRVVLEAESSAMTARDRLEAHTAEHGC